MASVIEQRKHAHSQFPVSTEADAGSLAAALRAHVRGEVRFDDGSRALYATDASNYRQPPIGVVLPVDADDVVAAVAVCRRFGVPILARGVGAAAGIAVWTAARAIRRLTTGK